MLRVILLCFMVGGAGFYLGRLQSEQTVRILGEQRKKAESQIEDMQTELTKLRAEAQTANIKLLQAHKSFNEALPEGPMQDLTLLLKEQIEGGVDPKRLETVLRSVRPPQNCSEPQTKRFVVMTPAYKGPESKMTTSEKEITLSGSGESAKNSKGKSEAWFDPSKTVTLIFELKTGVKQKKEGHLPLYHSVILGDKEFRFTITQGEQSFAKVTYDSCDYP
ncbi:MAG: hypothetical protein KDI61_08370 [Alphaproteobacteria bacterium]|nr:hypothetical protein [Alphaproteobacteria bacterium]MCB1840258.1 hypothetical protein [Alphaproteobacteria bacterium]